MELVTTPSRREATPTDAILPHTCSPDWFDTGDAPSTSLSPLLLVVTGLVDPRRRRGRRYPLVVVGHGIRM
jgi:hypothetical protein